MTVVSCLRFLYALPLLLLCACGSPLVGAECRAGYTRCDGRCVKLADDPFDCGSCGHDCGRFECRAGKCTTKPRPDAGIDGGAGDDGGSDFDGGKLDRDAGAGGRKEAGVGRGNIGGGPPFLPDGGLVFPDPMVKQSCAIGQTECAKQCVDIRSDARHCGACGHACRADQFCAMSNCVDVCDAPLKLCGQSCVDFDNDENHCGACGTACASGICETGTCADIIPGSLVVIGHDYTSAANAAMKRIAGNALFLARGAPVRALVYQGSAPAASISGVQDAIDAVVRVDGRAWQPVTADPDQLSAQLRDVNAFVIHAQSGSTDAELMALGQKWGLALSQFLLRGGVVVLFESVSTRNTGSFHLLEPAGLFTASGRATISGQRVMVVSPGVGVAVQTPNMYVAAAGSVHFIDILSAGNSVVEDRDPKTVVFHRVVSP